MFTEYFVTPTYVIGRMSNCTIFSHLSPTVCVRASEIWRGILLQARRAGDVTPVGTWSSDLPQNTRLLRCSSADDAVTHANTASKDNACFLWNPPAEASGDVYFV